MNGLIFFPIRKPKANVNEICRRGLYDYLKEYPRCSLDKKINYMKNCLLKITQWTSPNFDFQKDFFDSLRVRPGHSLR